MKPKVIKYCERCGREYTSNKKNSKYCSFECKYPLILVSCDNCGKEIRITQSQKDYFKTHFCGDFCKNEYKHSHKRKGKTELVKCTNCDKDTWTSKYQLKVSSTGRFYCSKKCRGEYKAKETGTITTKCNYCGKDTNVRKYEQKENYENRFCSRECQLNFCREIRIYPTGENHPLWNGGANDILQAIREHPKNKEWRIAVYVKGNHRCQNCGRPSTEAHHKKALSVIVFENNITTIEEALTCDELWDVENGETLCIDCHKGAHAKGVNQIKKRKYTYKNKEELCLQE